jgi:ABC-type branched-subunit amino acid transport system substrate-binding protein
MRSRRLTVVAVAALLACSAAEVLAQRPPPFTPGGAKPLPVPSTSTSTPTHEGLSLKIGALLPLNGSGAWFGAEIRQGLDLAAAELEPAPPKRNSAQSGGDATGSGTSPDAPGASGASSPPGDRGGALPITGGAAATSHPDSAAASGTSTPSSSKERPASPAVSGATASPPSGSRSETATTSAPAEPPKPAAPAIEPVEPPDQPQDVALVIQTADVQPLDVKGAEMELAKLLASGAVAVVTASPTPTLAVYPIASGRDVLVFHAGLATERFPATSRTLIQLRPSAAARADIMAAHAWARGVRRLAVLTGGDPFGRAVRTASVARWRQLGGQLLHEESLSLDASDLRSRLRAATRTGAEAVILGFQGPALGEAARALRGAGYTGQILAADDDRSAILAGGKAMEGMLILSDDFVPIPGSRGGRFAKAYEAKTGRAPSRFAANSYEAATLLAAAATRVGREGRGITGTRLRDVLAKAGPFPSLYAGELVVRDDGTIVRPLALFRVDAAKLVFESYVGPDGVALKAPTETTTP